MNEYPTEEQLKFIKEFDMTKHPVYELLDFIEPIWEYGDWGFHRQAHEFELHTGVWSGNEDIIVALHQNFIFWSMYWAKSERGGHIYFNDRLGTVPTKHNATFIKETK